MRPILGIFAACLACHGFGTSSLSSDVTFEGGARKRFDFVGAQVSHQGNQEKLTFLFSDPAKRRGASGVPRYQVRYVPGETLPDPEGKLGFEKKPRLIVTLLSLQHTLTDIAALRQLKNQSKHIAEVQLYPAIENGDTAVEIFFKEEIRVKPATSASAPTQLTLLLEPQKL